MVPQSFLRDDLLAMLIWNMEVNCFDECGSESRRLTVPQRFLPDCLSLLMVWDTLGVNCFDLCTRSKSPPHLMVPPSVLSDCFLLAVLLIWSLELVEST
jgi:hypothetical protein